MERKNRKLLVDGDILAFMCSTACEVPTKWNDDLWTLHASEEESITKLADTLTYYEEVCFIGKVVIALSDKDNFRRKVNPEYKSNRIGSNPSHLIYFHRPSNIILVCAKSCGCLSSSAISDQ